MWYIFLFLCLIFLWNTPISYLTCWLVFNFFFFHLPRLATSICNLRKQRNKGAVIFKAPEIRFDWAALWALAVRSSSSSHERLFLLDLWAPVLLLRSYLLFLPAIHGSVYQPRTPRPSPPALCLVWWSIYSNASDSWELGYQCLMWL